MVHCGFTSPYYHLFTYQYDIYQPVIRLLSSTCDECNQNDQGAVKTPLRLALLGHAVDVTFKIPHARARSKEG